MASHVAAGFESLYFHALRREEPCDASGWSRLIGLALFYTRLARYAASTDATIFHILWYNRFEAFDNVFWPLYYRALGKRLVLTAHNIDRMQRDGRRSEFLTASLRFLYRQVDYIFVHTEKMRWELERDFGVPHQKIGVIPYGINNAVPVSGIGRTGARQALGLRDDEKVLLFFGNIAPYKGLDLLLDALQIVPACRLVVAGRLKQNSTGYWNEIEERITQKGLQDRVIRHIRFIPDEKIELYFKAADVLVLPYRRIYQSGVLFLAYSFGLPVVATDVGDLRNAIQKGVTGYFCKRDDATALADAITEYFASDLYRHLEERRKAISESIASTHSWEAIGGSLFRQYCELSVRNG
jgi:glycosyltransferase involved in cell wall biosynthesis